MKIPSSIAPLSQPRNYASAATSSTPQNQTTTPQPSQAVQAQGLWSGIKNTFKEAWNAIKGFFQNLLPH